MAQNQPSRAIAVIPSDTINIPVPGIITSGTAAAPGTTLTDLGQNFLNSATNANGYNITGGDVVISAAGVISEIASIGPATDGTQLTLLTAIAAGTYDIYKGNYQILGESEGFTLFVGTGGPATVLRIQTVTGQDVTLLNVPDSSFIPIQVQRVWAATTTCSNIIALQ
jgi:hypothetical protein